MTYEEALNKYGCIMEKRKNDNNFNIVFCGVFSSGKSSLINCLLNSKFKLPTGINPITKLVTRISYGNELNFRYMEKGYYKSLTSENFLKFVTGEKPVPGGCTEIEIVMPSQILKNGVVIIDTPGFEDEMGGELEQMSRNALLEADMVVMCTSAVKPGDEFERTLIDDLEHIVGNYCLVMNRIDCLNTSEDLENVKKRAEFIMRNKGKRDHNGRKVFFTSSVGTASQLDGLDEYIGGISDDTVVKCSIAVSSRNSVRTYMFLQLVDELRTERIKLEKKYGDINAENNAGIDSRQKDYELLKMNYVNMVSSITNEYAIKLNGCINDIAAELTELKNNGYSIAELVDDGNNGGKKVIDGHIHFVDDARQAVLRTAQPFANEFDEAVCKNIGAYCNYYEKFKETVTDFPIPVPTRELVKKRGLLGRTLFSALDIIDEITSLSFDFSCVIDDGCDLVYNDYHTAAINKIRNELFPKLILQAKEVANKAYTQMLGEAPLQGGRENELISLKSEISQIDLLEEKIYARLGELRWKSELKSGI